MNKLIEFTVRMDTGDNLRILISVGKDMDKLLNIGGSANWVGKKKDWFTVSITGRIKKKK